MDTTTASPVEIDTALAEIYGREAQALTRHEGLLDAFLRIERALGSGVTYYSQSDLEDAHDRAEAALEAARVIELEAGPYDAEFYRRGGWTRAYLVLNNNGHVHRTQSCATTYLTTRWGWLPQLSGSSEADIIAAAGSDACTVCYPSAPVESLSRPRTVLHTTEVEAQAARDAKAAAKAERDAKKAAKTLDPPVKVFDFHVAERVIVERDGSKRTIPAHDRFETIETVHAAKSWLTDHFDRWSQPKRDEDVQAVATALGEKLGTGANQQLVLAEVRALKRK
jgi:hypothetical protein